MSDKTAAKNPAIVPPSQKTIADAKVMLAGATLQTIAIAATNASATLDRIKGTADAIKGSVTSAVIAVVSKAVIQETAGPVKAVLSTMGGRVPNLSTVRTAIMKMAAEYGTAYALPHWDSVAAAKAAGDGAFTALAESCYVDVDGVKTLDASRRVEAETKLVAACTLFGIADNASAKFKREFQKLVQAVAEQAELEQAEQAQQQDEQQQQQDSDAAIVADADAQLQAEIATLREIAEQAARIFGIEDRTALAIRMLDVPEIELTGE